MKESDVENCSGNGQCSCGCSGKGESDLLSRNPVVRRLCGMYFDLLAHDGFGELQVFVKILKRGQKEVIIKSGKEYRYVIDVPQGQLNTWE